MRTALEIAALIVGSFALGWMSRPYRSYRRAQIKRYSR